MSELTKRSAKYFFIQGLKTLGMMILVQMLLVVEWLIIGTSNGSLFEHISRELIYIGSYFTVIMNVMYSIYGPNWYDSLVLSMGARRKDIFWGEIIKQFVLVVGNTALLLVVCVTCSQPQLINFVLTVGFVGIMAGPLGLILGHKMKKYGMIVVFIIALCSGIAGALVAVSGHVVSLFEMISRFGVLGMGVLSVVLFLIFEVFVYKINLKSMVR